MFRRFGQIFYNCMALIVVLAARFILMHLIFSTLTYTWMFYINSLQFLCNVTNRIKAVTLRFLACERSSIFMLEGFLFFCSWWQDKLYFVCLVNIKRERKYAVVREWWCTENLQVKCNSCLTKCNMCHVYCWKLACSICYKQYYSNEVKAKVETNLYTAEHIQRKWNSSWTLVVI